MDWRMERLGVCDSTNQVAAERVREAWARGQNAEGIAVLAERQTAGKGQHGRAWESPAGGLYLSAVLERLPADLRGRLALIAGIAAVEALKQGDEQAPQRPLLRWPNDLMLRGKKVGGILCESIAQGDRWAGIVGIGLNVNTRVEDLPADVRSRATSVMALDGQSRDLHRLCGHVLHTLETEIALVALEGFGAVLRRVRKHDALLGQQVELRDGERTVRGIADGIGDAGELLIRTESGVQPCPMGTLISVAGERLR